jgi:hypothetical protein
MLIISFSLVHQYLIEKFLSFHSPSFKPLPHKKEDQNYHPAIYGY